MGRTTVPSYAVFKTDGENGAAREVNPKAKSSRKKREVTPGIMRLSHERKFGRGDCFFI